MARSRGEKRRLASGSAEDRVFHGLLCASEKENRENSQGSAPPKPLPEDRQGVLEKRLRAAEAAKLEVAAKSAASKVVVSAEGVRRFTGPSSAAERASAQKAKEKARGEELSRLLAQCSGFKRSLGLLRALR